jgi:hypothetical protein
MLSFFTLFRFFTSVFAHLLPFIGQFESPRYGNEVEIDQMQENDSNGACRRYLPTQLRLSE